MGVIYNKYIIILYLYKIVISNTQRAQCRLSIKGQNLGTLISGDSL